VKVTITVDDRYAGDVAELARVHEEGGALFIRAFDGDPLPVETFREVVPRQARQGGEAKREHVYATPGGSFTRSSVERAMDELRKAGLFASWQPVTGVTDDYGRKNVAYAVTLTQPGRAKLERPGRVVHLGNLWELRAFAVGMNAARRAIERRILHDGSWKLTDGGDGSG
jgi:hypothetical protein